jgi:hypothetical protein
VISRITTGLARAATVALVAGFSANLAAPAPAQAQNFFESLFGGGFQNRYHQRRSYAPDRDERYRDDRFPGAPDFNGERHASGGGEPRGSGVMCVRLCDGRHFPVPRSANGVALNPAKVCSSLCPAATTKVFNGGKPEYAVASDGQRYANLENAFVYREKIVENCSCTGKGPGGLAQIDVESDPTLRAGDVVATTAGLTVFKGSRSYPYNKTADFTPIDDYGRVNSDLRKKLAEVKVDPNATPSTPVQSLASADEEKPAATASSKPRRRSAPRQASREEPPPFFGWFR